MSRGSSSLGAPPFRELSRPQLTAIGRWHRLCRLVTRMSIDVKITRGHWGELMSTAIDTRAHIAYELIDDDNPEVVVIEFLSPEICGSLLAGELGEQLHSLIRPELPENFVIDF